MSNQISITKEFYVSKSAKVIFVNDFFVEDIIGGAELTIQAIMDYRKNDIAKLHSLSMTYDIIDNNKDKLFVLGNFSLVPRDVLSYLVTKRVPYVVVEMDYKYCAHRSEHHHLHMTGRPCDCHTVPMQGKWIEAFYKRAKKVFFMSEGQKNRYQEIFPNMKDWTNLDVQYSTWSKEDLDYILWELNPERKPNGKWAILQGASWIKNQAGTEAYCKENNMEYEILPRLPYRDFLKKLSEYKGLVFHPGGLDTCPRLVVEAKLLGLELDINDNVQIKYDKAFNEPELDKLLQFFYERPNYFWSQISNLL